MAILPDLTQVKTATVTATATPKPKAQTVTVDAAQLATMQAQIEALTAALHDAKAPKALTFKVSEKGAISVYGLNARFPVTLYAEQWERVLERAEALLAFCASDATNAKTGAGITRRGV